MISEGKESKKWIGFREKKMYLDLVEFSWRRWWESHSEIESRSVCKKGISEDESIGRKRKISSA